MSVAADSSGGSPKQHRYYAYGTVRSTDGMPTDYTFTGQKQDASSGLMFYQARYYDPALGRFAQPDSIVPNLYNPQSLNRYSYTLNNPVRYTDPTGHKVCEDVDCNETEVDLPGPGFSETGGGGAGAPAMTAGQQVPAGPSVGARVPSFSSENANRSLKNCGHYCRAELDVSIGWALGEITPILLLVCPECAVVTGALAGALAPASVGLTYASDIYESNYGGVTVGYGKTIFPIGTDYIYRGDMFTNRNPSEEDLTNFLTGFSVNAKAGLIMSGGLTITPFVGAAAESGTFTSPQVGASAGFSVTLPQWLPHLINLVTTTYPIPSGE